MPREEFSYFTSSLVLERGDSRFEVRFSPFKGLPSSEIGKGEDRFRIHFGVYEDNCLRSINLLAGAFLFLHVGAQFFLLLGCEFFFLFHSGSLACLGADLECGVYKPVREEASIGIYQDSVVSDEEALRRKVMDCLERYRQPALVEAFIRGREISVGAIGNGSCWRVFPPLEFLFEGAGSDLEMIRSYEYKWGGKKEQMVRAKLPTDVIQRLQELTVKALIATDCRDYARVDYRLDGDGSPFLLEVNYNPGIGPNTHGLNNTLTMMASFNGLSFEDLIEQVICIALERCRGKVEL